MTPPNSHLSPAIVRPAAPSDAQAIEQIEQASFIHAGERFGPRRIHYLLGTHRAIVTAAEAEGRVVGWAVGLVTPRRANPWGRIYALAVHPDGRGRKLGARLLKEMIAALRGRGAKRIFLEVRTDNHAAIKMYERAGFVPCKTLANYYAAGVDAIRMSLDAQD
jgi:ribosomal-protein-alanine acetyltransferase